MSCENNLCGYTLLQKCIEIFSKTFDFFDFFDFNENYFESYYKLCLFYLYNIM